MKSEYHGIYAALVTPYTFLKEKWTIGNYRIVGGLFDPDKVWKASM